MAEVTEPLGENPPELDPWVHTPKGYFRQSQLRIVPHWRYVPGEFAALSLRYYFGDEMVREDGHQCSLKRLASEAATGKFG